MMSPPVQAIQASELMGSPVRNSRGQDLGEVEELVIDVANGVVHYAIIDAQGERFAYPLRTLQVAPSRDHVLLNVAEWRLERAPGMRGDRWDDYRDEGFYGDLDPYWGRYWPHVETFWEPYLREYDPAWRPYFTNDPQWRERVLDRKTVQVNPRGGVMLAYASDQIGKNFNSAGIKEEVGEITDVVINPTNGKVLFAAVDFNENIGPSRGGILMDALHPVPITAFRFTNDRDTLLFTITDRGRLDPTYSFSDEQLNTSLDEPRFIRRMTQYANALSPGTPEGGAAGRAGVPAERQ